MPKNCARKSIVGDIISVVYIVMLTDGTIVEDLRSDDEPFEFRIGSRQAIAGLDIGLRDVCVGERLRLRVPSRLAHGSKGFESLVSEANLAAKFSESENEEMLFSDCCFHEKLCSTKLQW